MGTNRQKRHFSYLLVSVISLWIAILIIPASADAAYTFRKVADLATNAPGEDPPRPFTNFPGLFPVIDNGDTAFLATGFAHFGVYGEIGVAPLGIIADNFTPIPGLGGGRFSKISEFLRSAGEMWHFAAENLLELVEST